jgi:hypothetical protein
MEYGDEVRSVEVLKAGVAPERLADHEPRRNATHGFAFGLAVMDWKTVKRLNALT